MKRSSERQDNSSRAVANSISANRMGVSQHKSVSQLVGDEEKQLKSKTAQLVPEEEKQLKSKTAQFVPEEEKQLKSKTTQLVAEEEKQLKSKITQLVPEEEKQLKADTTQLKSAENKTGMPDNLKSGIENLSGVDVSDVRVHYNSSKPAQMNAHAYAQGTNIHVSPGQEKHVPHEAWHTVQQKQGRVTPTTSVNGTPVNDSVSLETEADVMGAKANSFK